MDTIAPVIPLTPRATRQRKPNRRPGSIPAPGSNWSRIAAGFRALGVAPDQLRSLAALDAEVTSDVNELADLMEQQAPGPRLLTASR